MQMGFEPLAHLCKTFTVREAEVGASGQPTLEVLRVVALKLREGTPFPVAHMDFPQVGVGGERTARGLRDGPGGLNGAREVA